MVSEIKALCQKNKTSIKSLERELGFGNGTIRRWDDSSPALDKVKAVATFFGVSVSELTGEAQKNSPLPDGNGRSDEFIRLFSRLTPEEQARELAYLRSLVDKTDK